jgi:hypothetical protein
MKQDEIRKIVVEAFLAAQTAAEAHVNANPGVWYPCGFSWVRFKPARGPIVAHLKSINIGYTDEYNGGYAVYNPSQNPTQWMDAKMVGSRAFADVMKKYGIACQAEERID